MSESAPAARPDLLSLTDDALAALSNRGIVRRARRELEDGGGPTISTEADLTVTGRFADGILVTIPPGTSVQRATCSCPASGLCRHRVAVVLAYQAQASPNDGAELLDSWSPGAFTDEQLEAEFGARLLATARRNLAAGYHARVRRPTSADPVPSVEMGSCTVRFLVPNALGYANTDAAGGSRDDAVALAVWAFRAADQQAPDAPEVVLDVGGEVVDSGSRRSGLEPALALVGVLLTDGAVHVGAAIDGTVATARRALDSQNLRWPVDVVDAITDQLLAYRDRSARYSQTEFATLLAEVHARHRCVAGGGATLRSQVLGSDEAAETQLRRLRLTSLGCRVSGDSDSRSVHIYLAHSEAVNILVLRRRWELGEDELPTGADLGLRRIAGTTVAGLAAGNVVTESAVRSARRQVHLASNRVGRTTITTSSGDWSHLPEGILVQDLHGLAAALSGLAPRMVRPRLEAELVRVIEVAEVLDISYSPGSQLLRAQIRAPDGGLATVAASHRGIAPGALDALQGALEAHPRYVAGAVSRFRGEVMVDPISVATATGVTVPDLAAGDGSGALTLGRAAATAPLQAALDSAIETSAEIAHRGLRNLRPGYGNRLQAQVDHLRRVGLPHAADALAKVRVSVGSEPDPAAMEIWADAHIRLVCTAESL